MPEKKGRYNKASKCSFCYPCPISPSLQLLSKYKKILHRKERKQNISRLEYNDVNHKKIKKNASMNAMQMQNRFPYILWSFAKRPPSII